jgi:hypothetical protein
MIFMSAARRIVERLRLRAIGKARHMRTFTTKLLTALFGRLLPALERRIVGHSVIDVPTLIHGTRSAWCFNAVMDVSDDDAYLTG